MTTSQYARIIFGAVRPKRSLDIVRLLSKPAEALTRDETDTLVQHLKYLYVNDLDQDTQFAVSEKLGLILYGLPK